MIFNPKIASAQNKISNSDRKVTARKSKSDKRKRRSDRRSSVRDGVIVNLSFESNMRKGSDRRRLQT